jgi:hypothetical protein
VPGLVRRTRPSPELKFRPAVAQQLRVLAERSEAQQSGVVGPAQFVEQHPSQAPPTRSAKWGGFTGVLHSPEPGRPRRLQSGPKARTGSALAWVFAQKFCANTQ